MADSNEEAVAEVSAPENPPAFPSPEIRLADGTGICAAEYGMHLRDYLAAHAPVNLLDAAITCGWAGLEAAKMPQDSYRQTLWAVLTLMRYEYADAMLEQRARAATLMKEGGQ